MALSVQDQKRIIEQESAWVDQSFAQVDLTGFPALNELPAQDKRDERFSKDWRDTPFSASAAELRRFVDDPDVEALSRVGEETGNPGLLRDVRDRRGEVVAAEFKRRCPSYLPTDSNYRAITTTLAFNSLPFSEQNGDVDELVQLLIERGYWTPRNLEACYRTLDREGLLDVPAGTARNLSEAELLRVMRLAQNGHGDAAIGEFLNAALDEEPDMELINDPAYRSVCDRAVLYVWECATADYSPNAERREFMRRYAAGRPRTLHLLDSAWVACQQNEQRHERAELLAPYEKREIVPPTEKELDGLDDKAVDDLYHASLRSSARFFGRPSGVLA
jgi:hypothetical protein